MTSVINNPNFCLKLWYPRDGAVNIPSRSASFLNKKKKLSPFEMSFCENNILLVAENTLKPLVQEKKSIFLTWLMSNSYSDSKTKVDCFHHKIHLNDDGETSHWQNIICVRYYLFIPFHRTTFQKARSLCCNFLKPSALQLHLCLSSIKVLRFINI